MRRITGPELLRKNCLKNSRKANGKGRLNFQDYPAPTLHNPIIGKNLGRNAERRSPISDRTEYAVTEYIDVDTGQTTCDDTLDLNDATAEEICTGRATFTVGRSLGGSCYGCTLPETYNRFWEAHGVTSYVKSLLKSGRHISTNKRPQRIVRRRSVSAVTHKGNDWLNLIICRNDHIP